MNREEYEIVSHAINRAANGFYLASHNDPWMKSLVEKGLMQRAGPGWTANESYYSATTAGHRAYRIGVTEPC